MHEKQIEFAGKKVQEAEKALIMIHGRGGSAADILSLAGHLQVNDFALAAPEATNNSWYPYSFLAPPSQNEPWLSSALSLLASLVKDLTQQGIKEENIYFLGFSQGACLTLEFTTRNARKWGGIVAFTGGLIGDRLYPDNYKGNFNQTPVFIGSSDPDAHVPVTRVHATTEHLRSMHALVTEEIYLDMGHTISSTEIRQANALIFEKLFNKYKSG